MFWILIWMGWLISDALQAKPLSATQMPGWKLIFYKTSSETNPKVIIVLVMRKF